VLEEVGTGGAVAVPHFLLDTSLYVRMWQVCFAAVPCDAAVQLLAPQLPPFPVTVNVTHPFGDRTGRLPVGTPG
jgi:hypothetical protein